MKRVLNIFLLLICFETTSVGQDKSALFKKELTPIELVNRANKLAETDAKQSMKLASEALEISLALKDKQGEYHAYNTLGTLYYNIGNYAKAVKYFNDAYIGFTSIRDEKGKVYAGKYLTLALEKQQKYEEALKIVNEEERKIYSSKAETDNTKYKKARLMSKLGRSKEAISDLKTLARDSSLTTENRIRIYNELGDIYVTAKDTLSAYKVYEQVMNLPAFNAGNLNSNTSRQGYLEAIKKFSDLKINSGKAFDNIKVQNYVLNEGLKSRDTDLVQLANYNIGNTFLNQNEHQRAIPYLTSSAAIARSRNNPIEEQKSVKDLAKAYEKLGQYHEALDVYKRYIHLTDSFKNLQNTHEELSLALNKEFLKQEERIKGLINTQKEKEASIQRQKAILWTLGAGLLLFVLLTWALVRNIRQKQTANMLIKLQSLRTQMNPHFIFNSLNSVNNFIAKNDERSANKYLSDFSKLMRIVLKNSDQDFVALSSEIETLGIYLGLEHFRFGDKFEYSLDVEDDINPDELRIPSMLIQPYIENAIWHGLRYREEKGILQVKFYIDDEKLFCSIYDNGIGRKKSAELKTEHQKAYQSTGIKNTKERIEILNSLHKTTLGISLEDLEENGVGTGTLVKISLPYLMEQIPGEPRLMKLKNNSTPKSNTIK